MSYESERARWEQDLNRAAVYAEIDKMSREELEEVRTLLDAYDYVKTYVALYEKSQAAFASTGDLAGCLTAPPALEEFLAKN